MNKPTRHSYSSLAKYDRCALQWKYSYVDKLPDPSGKAALRGTRLHSAGEKFLLGQLKKLPLDYWRVQKYMDEYTLYGAKPEATVLVNAKWQPVITEENAKLKAVIDVHYIDGPVLYIIDLKTGKEYDSHVDQLRLYAAMGMCAIPRVDEVRVGALYIDAGKLGAEATYDRVILPDLISYFDKRIAKLENDNEYIPSPDNSVCRFCPYSFKKGGPCKFSAE